MVKRLTEYFENGAYTTKENIIDVSDKVKFFENGCLMGKAINKLAQLEDIMEKYHCNDIEELEKKLADSDTWQKACELACEREDDCYVYDNIHRAYEFYQQAKTEGNDE